MQEDSMPNKVRVNMANAQELLELPGIDREKAERIVRFRAQHGPISNESELSRVLGLRALDAAVAARVDFAPSEATAPEAPGA
jgi:DNA uptake protein ComE-like DNA-binding protein